MLSRLPMGPDHFFNDQHSLNVVVNLIQDSRVQELSISAPQVQKETKADSILQKFQVARSCLIVDHNCYQDSQHFKNYFLGIPN